jgi:hypothetical protein
MVKTQLPQPTQETGRPPAEERPPSLWRAIGAGLAGVAVLCAVTPYSDLLLRGSWIAHNCLPIGALVLLLILTTGINRLLVRLRRTWAFTRAELMLVYVMLLVAAGIPSVGLAQCVLGVTVAPTYYANGTNDWANQLHPLLPAWLRLVDEDAIRAYFNGARGEGGVPWRLWLAPLAAWSLFALLLYTAFFCLSLLLRRAWIYQERLAFPLVQVPLELVGRERVPQGNAAFFRNPLALLGMAVPALCHTLNSLHNLSPSIPAGFTSPIPIGELLVDRPWSALSDARIFVYFSVIGLSYLLAGEVSLSLWFFHLLARAQLVLFSAIGFDERTGAEAVGFSPSWFVTNQMWGALFGFGAFLVWDGLRGNSARSSELGARSKGGGRSSPRASSPELRAAFIGLCVSLLLMAFWLTAAGGRFPIQLLGLLLWVAAMLSLARLVAAGGLVLIDTNYLPRDILYRVLGAEVVRPADLTALTYHNTVFAYYPQLNMLPFMFNGLKISDEAGWGPGALATATGAALLLAIPLSFAVTLPLVYARGALTLNTWNLGGMPRQNFLEMTAYLQSPARFQPHTLLSLGVGAGVMGLLVALRRGVTWWPLSPLGYMVGGSWTVMHHLWFCVFLGWLANALVRRYGGLREFLRFRPFFLGLVVGEFLTAAVWLGIDALLGITGHNVFPGPG